MIAADARRGCWRSTRIERVSDRCRSRTVDDPIGYADRSRRGAGRRRSTSPIRPDALLALATGAARIEASVPTSSSNPRRPRARPRPGDWAHAHRRAGLSFANGIALSSDGHTLFVTRDGPLPCLEDRRPRAATSTCRRLAAGPRAAREPAGLPGQPDARTRRPALGRTVQAAQPGGGRLPSGRSCEVLLRLPRFLLPLGQPYGHVFAIDEDGRVTADLQDPSGAYPETTARPRPRTASTSTACRTRSLDWLPRDAQVRPIARLQFRRSALYPTQPPPIPTIDR